MIYYMAFTNIFIYSLFYKQLKSNLNNLIISMCILKIITYAFLKCSTIILITRHVFIFGHIIRRYGDI